MTITTPDDITIKRVINTLTIKQLSQFSIIVLCALTTIFLFACSSSSAYKITNRPPADCSSAVYTALNLTCSEGFSLANNPVVGIDVADVSSSSEFIVLKLLPFRKPSNQQSDITAKVEISVFTLVGNSSATLVDPTETKELSIDCSTTNVDDCKTDTALTLSGIGRNHYYIVVNFINAQDLSPLFNDIGFTTTTLNLGVFLVKSLFLAAAIAGFYFYSNKIKDLKKDFYCEEQKALQLLFPLLIVIDEPFTSYVFGGFIYTWLKISVYVGFSTLVIRLWLSTAHGLAGPDPLVMKYYEHSQAVKIYLVAYAAVAWLTYVVFHFSVSSDPSEGYGSAPGFFLHIFKLLLFVVILAGLIWVGRSLVVIFKESNVFNQREGYFLLLSVLFFVIHACLVIQGDLDPLAYDAQKLILFSGTSTLYVLCLAYMYLPVDEGISQANYLKKYANPGLKDAYDQLDESSTSPPARLVKNISEPDQKKVDLAGARAASETQPLDIENV